MVSEPVEYSVNAKSITSSEVQTKLNTLLGEFPSNTTWNRRFAGGSQCYAFAHYIFNTIFDRGNKQVGNGALSSNPTCYKLNNVASDINTIGTLAPGYSLEQLECLLEKAMPGDYLQVKRRNSGGPHSMIVTWVNATDNKIGIFDANAIAANKVGQYEQSFSDFMQRNAGVTLYRYYDYKISDTCNCNESYKGDYTVMVDSVLNMRSGHGREYSLITTIPKGERVYISKGNGSWAHVQWNGYSGYCDMSYLKKIELKDVKLCAWISDSKMGNVPEKFKIGKTYYLCYEVIDLSTGEQFNDVNYNYSISETLYNPDGREIGTYRYENSNNNWISYSSNTPGVYKGVVTISGDINLKVEVSYEVKANKVEDIRIQDSNGNYRNNLLMKNIGDTVLLKAVISPDDAEDKTVTWTSTDPTIVSVDSHGKIVAQKDGVAKIIVASKDGGSSASCNVKVKTYGIVYGDCNGDGAVTATDISVLNQAVNGTLKLSEEEKKVFDLNGDGRINNEDMELLKQFILGTRTSFPVEEQLSEIVISTMPKKTTYYVGDSISVQGITVKAYYNNGLSKIVDNLVVNGETSSVGKQLVTLSYTESGITKSVSYFISVKQREAVKATALPIETPIDTNNPTSVPVKTQNPMTNIEITAIPNPTEAESAKPTAIPSWGVTDGEATIAPSEPVATPIIKSTISPSMTPTTSNGQNNKNDDAGKYDVFGEENILQKGDVFEIKSAIYEVTNVSDIPTVELVTIEKRNLKTVAIPANVKYKGITYKVTSIAKGSFKNNKQITSLIVGSNVMYIGSYAFYKNSKLKKITIKSVKLKKIQKKAFYGLAKKVVVKLPASKREHYKTMLKDAGLGN